MPCTQLLALLAAGWLLALLVAGWLLALLAEQHVWASPVLVCDAKTRAPGFPSDPDGVPPRPESRGHKYVVRMAIPPETGQPLPEGPGERKDCVDGYGTRQDKEQNPGVHCTRTCTLGKDN